MVYFFFVWKENSRGDSDEYHRFLQFIILDLHKSEAGPSNILISQKSVGTLSKVLKGLILFFPYIRLLERSYFLGILDQRSYKGLILILLSF